MIEVRHDDPKENAMTYTHHLTLDQPYAQAVESVRAALSEQGFGIITEIDMRATFEKKLDAEPKWRHRGRELTTGYSKVW